MKNVYVYCEGQTEESFINTILVPYFANMDIWLRPIVCSTKKTLTKKYKGGVSDYQKIKKELTILCKSHKHEFVTTMFDYYAMPTNTPMIDCADSDLYVRIDKIEKAITADIGQDNCFFNLSVHEFEGLLFSNPDSFRQIAPTKVVAQIQAVKDSFPSPEHVNNSPLTAPSKRLEQIIHGYSMAKVTNGSILSRDMGINVLLENCKHFSDWVKRIAQLSLSHCEENSDKII